MRRTSPDYYEYKDTGCEVAPRCLSCPRSSCKYDDPHYRRVRQVVQDAPILEAMQDGALSAEAAARRFNVNVRTIYRVKARSMK